MDVPARRAEGDVATRAPDQAQWLAKLAGVINESSGQDLGLHEDMLRAMPEDEQLECFRKRMQAAGFLPPGAGVAPVRGMLRVFSANSSTRYVPRDAHPVPIVLFRAGEFHRDYDFSPADDPGCAIAESSLGWREYAEGEVAVHVAPGNHITMMSEPHVALLAEALRACLGGTPGPA
jgi:hypothetical protein